MEAEKPHDLQARDPGKLVWGQEKMRCATSLNQGERVDFLCLHLLLYLGCEQIGRGPPTLGRAIGFTESTSSNANLIQTHPGAVYTLGTSWPVELTHKINYQEEEQWVFGGRLWVQFEICRVWEISYLQLDSGLQFVRKAKTRHVGFGVYSME